MKAIEYNAMIGITTERELTAEEIAEMEINNPTIEPSPEELRAIYEQDVANRIRQKYSIDEELSILRQCDVKVEEFQEYFDYCEECKQEVRIALEML